MTKCTYPPCLREQTKCVVNTDIGGHQHLCVVHAAMVALYADESDVAILKLDQCNMSEALLI